jgi:ribosomal protein S27E
MRTGQCPSCGAPVEFPTGGGRVRVCPHCTTVVLFGEFKLEDLGRVADLVDTDSPLSIGLFGKHSGIGFQIKGRVQKKNSTGLWDEWFLEFEDARNAWLAESEGEWKILFPLEGMSPAKAAEMKPLSTFDLRGKTFVAEEVNQAETVSAEGELPAFNRTHHYVDATGPKGVFATLDSADGVTEAYVGNILSLSELGFDRNELAPQGKRSALKQAKCPTCNGPLELKAPDATKRVACPFCGALHEVTGGQLAFLQQLEKPPYEPIIKLGTSGTIDEMALFSGTGSLRPPSASLSTAQKLKTSWTCIAFLIRSCTVNGTRYPWDEYLLWNKEEGFRWVMNSNGHFTWLKPVGAGEVELPYGGASFRGTSYKVFQSVFAQTDYVAGECYWAVSVGETARATEYVAPPHSINCDQTENEVTFTHGVMFDSALLQTAFKLKNKPQPAKGIASASPNVFSKKAKEAWVWTGIWAAALICLFTLFSVMGNTDIFLEERFSALPTDVSGSPEAQRFSKPFDVSANVPLEVTVTAHGLYNSWLGLSVDLVNETTGEVIAVYAEPSRYSGTEDGESWSEGSDTEHKQTASVDKGRYVLRATPSFEGGHPVDYTVKVQGDDSVGFCCPFFMLLLLLVVPIYYTIRSTGFETSRWNESVFQAAPGISNFSQTSSSSSDSDWSDNDDSSSFDDD